MNVIYATYNIHHNSIDVYTYTGYFLRIDCNNAEEGLKTTSRSECALNALAIDEPLEYARLYLEGNMQMWKTALNCGNFNSPEFGGIKSLQNLCSLFFQNRHLMYGNLVKLY